MKKIGLMALVTILMLTLSACSLRSDAADLYKKESPLMVQVDVPESISTGEEVIIETVLTQVGKSVEQADFVHFELWKQDGTVRYPMEEAEEAGEGVYRMAFEFQDEGLYYIEVHAGNKGSVVSLQHQFIVGELSDEEMEILKQGPTPAEETPEHHH